ncbi:MAG: hypothetical protein GYA39_02805 [Methanothrix sp.]|nr:hypothetical protein [Methanothrix sp.]
MRSILAIMALLSTTTFAVCSGSGEEYIYVKDVTMRLNGENATFELNYSLDTFTRLYVLALGCRYLEPELISFLGNYHEVKLLKADINSAALQVNDAGKYNGGYYLFDSRPLGSRTKPINVGVAKFTVVYPEGQVRTFYNVTCTQSVFCQASSLNRTTKKVI